MEKTSHSISSSVSNEKRMTLYDPQFLELLLGVEWPIVLRRLTDEMSHVEKSFLPQCDIQNVSDQFYKLFSDNLFWPLPSFFSAAALEQKNWLQSTSFIPPDTETELWDATARLSQFVRHGIELSLSLQNWDPPAKTSLLSWCQTFAHLPRDTANPTSMRLICSIDHLEILDILSWMSEAPESVRLTLSLTPDFFTALASGSRLTLRSTKRLDSGKSLPATDLYRLLLKQITAGNIGDLILADPLRRLLQDPSNFGKALNTHNLLVKPLELTASAAINLETLTDEMGAWRSDCDEILDLILRFLDDCFENNTYPDALCQRQSRQSRHVALIPLGLNTLLSRRRHTQSATDLLQELDGKIRAASHQLAIKRGGTRQKSELRDNSCLAMLSVPELSQITGAAFGLTYRNIKLQELSNLYKSHQIIEAATLQPAPLRHPLRQIDAAHLTRLLLSAAEGGVSCFELAGR